MNRTALISILLSLALVLLFIADLAFGSVSIPVNEILSALFSGGASAEKYNVLVIDSRLPRAITAILCGAGLGVSGLLMQSLFRNPVAGPYILGVSSGAGLGVAITVLAGSGTLFGGLVWSSEMNLSIRVLAAGLGAFGSLLIILFASKKITDAATLLIMGLMIAAFTSAFTGILQYFASSDALRDFIYWTFGSLDHTHWSELSIMSPLVIGGLFCSILISRPLNLMLLGEDQAKTLGLNTDRIRTYIIVLTALLAGVITAYCGPIAFVGIAVPHVVRSLVKSTRHEITIPLTMLAGSALMLGCDLISRMPWTTISLPINAVTSLIGAPVVILILWRYKRIGQYFG